VRKIKDTDRKHVHNAVSKHDIPLVKRGMTKRGIYMYHAYHLLGFLLWDDELYDRATALANKYSIAGMLKAQRQEKAE
jgi:hypothetical protein